MIQNLKYTGSRREIARARERVIPTRQVCAGVERRCWVAILLNAWPSRFPMTNSLPQTSAVHQDYSSLGKSSQLGDSTGVDDVICATWTRLPVVTCPAPPPPQIWFLQTKSLRNFFYYKLANCTRQEPREHGHSERKTVEPLLSHPSGKKGSIYKKIK